jgi:hypothetical protein
MAESREEAALKAGWRPHPLLTDRAIAFQWRYPQLHLRVWAQLDGMHVLAYVEYMGEDARLVVHDVARAVWHPKEVTEELVVEWGQRALSRWLGDRLTD